MSRTLFLVGTLGLASGIVVRSSFLLSWEGTLLLLVLAAACGGLWFLKQRVLYVAASVFFLAAFLGVVRVMVVPSTLPDVFVPFVGQEVSFTGRIVGDPDLRETSQRVAILVEQENVETLVLAVAQKYPHVAYGEDVRVRGVLVYPEPFSTDGGREFRYDRFLAKDGVFALIENAQLHTTAPREGLGDMAVGMLLDAKHAFLDGLTRALPEPHASLAAGLVAGGKQGLGKELLAAFIISGLVHIVVLSGYNVMIVAEAVMRLFGFLSRRAAALAACLVIGAFVLMAGAGAASIRAGLMAVLSLIARATGRTYAVVRALLAAGVLMVLWNPLLLVYDPGFQLSFVATLGLILLAPLLEARLKGIKNNLVRDLLASTCAAQIAVLPLLLYQTGQLSTLSLLANMLVLPVVPISMAFSALAGLAGLLVPTLAPVFGLPAYALLSYILSIAEFVASVPRASLAVPAFPFWITCVAYLGLGWLVWVSQKREASSRP